MTSISVLLAVYNTNPKHLNECIDSILNQTFKDFELIILDDCSTNKIAETIKTYKDKRIRYYRNQKNQGITKTRNKLLTLATGKYIAIHDHDDISMPQRLEKEYNFLENQPDISIVSGWIEVFSDKYNKTKIWKTKPYPRPFDFLKQCELIHPACMWRKSDFEKFELMYEDNFYGVQDYALFTKAIKYVNFANLQEVLLRYRKHINNASNNKKEMSIETEIVQKRLIEF